jgi:hypothetical protein
MQELRAASPAAPPGSRPRPTARRLALVLALVLALGGAALQAAGSAGAAASPGDPLGLIGSDPTQNSPQPTSTLFDPPPPGSTNPADIGAFTTPFVEPTITLASGSKLATTAPCVRRPGVPEDPTYDGPIFDCKPAGVSVNVLPNGKIMYFDGLEGTENVKYSIVAEYGNNSVNDQSRLLDLHGNPTGQSATWTNPSPVDGGANPGGYAKSEPILPAPLVIAPTDNAGALFCTDNIFLPDGTILANGGTAYYSEPGVKVGTGVYGVAELEGLKNSRIYMPRTNTWVQSGDMHYGRWYPSTVTLPSGKVLAVSGVTKLLKPVYLTHIQDSGSNVKQTETYDPVAGTWTVNPGSASKSLPLFPRIHELPDGKIFYNAAGQSFNPFGQSYDEASWNIASVYDPAKQTWTDLGVPGLTDLSAGKPADLTSLINDAVQAVRQGGIPGGGNAVTLPGFRGSTFSMELPLVPDALGNYTQASFLTAGGVLNPPSPGSYFSTSDSRITTVNTAGGSDKMSTHPTGDLPGPRWFPSGVLLPTGEVLAFNGSDRDEVVGPGVEIGKRQAELFNPTTETWSPVASSHDVRTYHNAAALLPDGRVLVSGHAPISFLYTRNITLPGGVTAPNNGRDASFEIYNPPYMYWGPQPKITSAPPTSNPLNYGQTFQVTTDQPASDIHSVVLVSNPSVTHLVDPNQRNVVLPVISRVGNVLTVKSPPNADVAPPGPYMLFVNKQMPKGLEPSASTQLFLGISGLEASARDARSRLAAVRHRAARTHGRARTHRRAHRH